MWQLRGERRILERLVQSEIAMLSAVRDGSAVLMHMEDFYFMALLKVGVGRVGRVGVAD